MNVGFVGIGHMGEPMARNLLRAGIPVTVWNRSPEKCEALFDIGAQRATSLQDVFKRSTTVMLMLLNSQVIDAVLRRRTPGFAALVHGRCIVQLGTTSPDYSKELEFDITAAGGTYVEAPVSGSREPAEQGQLVGMVAGHVDAMERVLPLLEPLCARVFRCGQVPGALRMKLAANHYLIGMVTVLAETVHAARSADVIWTSCDKSSMPAPWRAPSRAASWTSSLPGTSPRKRRSAMSARLQTWSSPSAKKAARTRH